MLSRLFHQLLDQKSLFENSSNQLDTELLLSVCDCYDLDNLIYTRLSLSGIYSPFTLSIDPENRQIGNLQYHTKKLNPIIAYSIKNRAPFDWQECKGPNQKPVLDLANLQKCTKGANGFSVPIRQTGQIGAVVSMVSQYSGDHWKQYINQYKGHLIRIAYFLHERYTRFERQSEGLGCEESDLTVRELEALQWASIGKTSEETGMILGISKRAVNFHVSNAKLKLNASSKTHAVAKSLSIDLTKFEY